MTKKPEEPISGILKEAPTVQRAFGGFFGFVLMAMAILATKKRWPWVIGITGISAAARLAGLI